MKFLLILVAFCTAVSAQPIPVKDYPLKDVPVDDPRFQGVLHELIATEKKESRRVTILQNVSPGRYLAQINDENSAVLLLTTSGPYADGDTFTAIVGPTAKLHEYENTMGAKRTVRIWEEGPPLTAAALIERLKKGETFPMKRGLVNVPCSQCSGRGMVSASATCKRCAGRGVASLSQPVKICWESKPPSPAVP